MEAIFQSESAECGLACLAMIATHHGNHTCLMELRRLHPPSVKGATLNQLISVASVMGLASRPLRLEVEEISRLRVPCILHWDMNHFVVLAKVGARSVTVYDPSIGRKACSHAELSRRFTGVALEVSPAGGFEVRKPVRRFAWSDITGRIRGIRRGLVLLLLLSFALQSLAILAPFLLQWIVDHVLIAGDMELLKLLGLGFLLLLLLQVAVGLVRGWAVIQLSNTLGLQWAGNVFGHMVKLPMNFYEKRSLGDITSRMSSVQEIQRAMTKSFVESIVDGAMAMATVGMMLVYSWKLTLMTLVAVLIYVAIRRASFSALRGGTEAQLAASARQHTYLIESIRGMQSLKLSGGESGRIARYRNMISETANKDIWLARFGLMTGGVNQLIFGIERLAVICIGSALAIQGAFSVGMLIAYLAYKDQFTSRVGSFIDHWLELRMLRLHGERLSDIVSTEQEGSSGQVGCRDMSADLRIEIDGLGFRHSESDPWVFRGLHAVIEFGECVAIVGPSGCGKTTLLKVLLGLLRPTEGQIRIGGVSLESIRISDYRRIIGSVMQDDVLFAGSIRDNIRSDDGSGSDSEVYEAASCAAIHDDVLAMPMGYCSLIGDMGNVLSGGQKQRIVLARALYRKPMLLFLDEATSHLDVDCERLVSEAIARLAITRVIIAHRPETIASADRVLYMNSDSLIDDENASSVVGRATQ